MRLLPLVLLLGLAGLLPAAAGQSPTGQCEALFERRLYAEAKRQCTAEAEAGDLHAAFRLGTLLYEGHPGVPRDIPAAVGWYERAVARGHPGARFELMLHHMQDGPGTSYATALDLMRQVAVAGLPGRGGDRDQAIFCAEHLAKVYDNALGVPRDAVEAHAWLAVARELGDDQLGPVIADLEGRMSAAEKQAAGERAAALKR